MNCRDFTGTKVQRTLWSARHRRSVQILATEEGKTFGLKAHVTDIHQRIRRCRAELGARLTAKVLPVRGAVSPLSQP